MDIQIEWLDNIIIVRLSGELNQRTSPPIQEQIVPLIQPNCKFLLDMSDVTYLSSAGLRFLLLLYRQITDGNGDVVLTNLSEMVEDTMAITGFLTFFSAYPTVDEGLKALNTNNTGE